MTWTRAALYWACFLGLTAYWTFGLREPSLPQAKHLTRAAFLNIPADDVVGFEVKRGDADVRCRHEAGRWQVVEPAGRAVPSDLIAALIGNLTQLPDVEVVAEQPGDLTQFGLDKPASEITLTRKGGSTIGVRLGGRNPAGTAVYAQRTDSPRIYLIGLNVRYYEDLVFEALRPRA